MVPKGHLCISADEFSVPLRRILEQGLVNFYATGPMSRSESSPSFCSNHPSLRNSPLHKFLKLASAHMKAKKKQQCIVPRRVLLLLHATKVIFVSVMLCYLLYSHVL